MTKKPTAIAILIFWAVLLCTGAGWCGPRPKVKIMTWNIAGAISSSSWNSTNAQRLGRIVNYYQPDVLALNECASGSSESERLLLQQNLISWANTFLTSWPEKHVYVSVLSDGYNRNALVSRYPMYGFTNQSLTPRGLLGAMVDIPGEPDIKVYSAHLKAYSDPSSAQQRQTGANSYKNHVINWSYQSANVHTPYFLTGDWNEDEENPQYPLSSTYRPISTIMEAFVNEFKPDDGWGKTKTYSSGSPTRRFDYVLPSWHAVPDWTNSGTSWSRVINTMVLFDRGQLPGELFRLDSQGSDHLSVIGTFELLDTSIPGVRSSSDGEYVVAIAKHVTASFGDHFYIQEPGKPSAVRVNGTAGNPLPGYVVNVKGTLKASANEEDAIEMTGIRILNTLQGTVRPLGVRNRDISGEPHNGVDVDGQTGPRLPGVLVKTWGRVVDVEAGYFTIDDGGGFPVVVESAAGVARDDYVSVVGVIGYRIADGKPVRFVRTRSASDVQKYNR